MKKYERQAMYKAKHSYLLMKKTLELLKEDERSMLTLHKETGISFYWLRKFKAGKFIDPSVNKVQFLYEHLTQTKLSI